MRARLNGLGLAAVVLLVGACAQSPQVDRAVTSDVAEQVVTENFSDIKARIVSQMPEHSAAVRRLSVDRNGRLLVTTAEDKSARIWDIQTGALKHTLRPRIGPGREGLLYGAAIHPNEPIVAVAGSVFGVGESSADRHTQIALFRIDSGAFLSAIPVGPGEVKDLAWSADGTLLAAVTARTNQFLVFDRQGRRVWAREFSGPMYGLDAGPHGHFVASSFDGSIVVVTARSTTVGDLHSFKTRGKKPDGVAISPDSKHILIGFHQAKTAPELYRLTDGQFVRRLALPDFTNGAINRVRWSADGSRVVAAGRAYLGRLDQVPVYWYDTSDWTVTGKTFVASNSVLDIEATTGAQFAFGSFDGSWGVVQEQGLVKSITAKLSQVRGPDDLLVSESGEQVAWHVGGKKSLGFDYAVREVGQPEQPLLEPITKRGLFDRSTWKNALRPVINGRSVKLGPSEIGRSLSYGRTQSADAYFGTSQRLMRIDPAGRVIWAVRTAGEVQAVNIASNDRVVVSAMSDGTIRWRRTRDGQLFLTLLVTKDERWVSWLPTGHFDAGIGGDRIAGWAVNRVDEPVADFHSLGSFRDEYNRPGFIDKVFRSLEPATVASFDQPTAPLLMKLAEPAVGSDLKVKLGTAKPAKAPELFPPVFDKEQTGAVLRSGEQLNVNFALTSQVDEVDLIVQLDGRRLPDVQVRFDPNAADPKLKRGTVVFSEPVGGKTLRLMASNTIGYSQPVEIQYVPASNPAPPEPLVAPLALSSQSPAIELPATNVPQGAGSKRSRLFVLAIGVANYQVPDYRLDYAAKDAHDFTLQWQTQSLSSYRSAQVRVLTDEEATRERIVEGLYWLRDNVRDGDVVVVFLAGHGVNGQDGSYYFLPYEARAENLGKTAVSERILRDVLVDLRGKVLLFVDTCHGGAAISRTASLELSRLANTMSSDENGVIVFASSEGRQLAEESHQWKNGAFTAALLKGISGEASFGRGYVTVKSLDLYLSDEVARMTEGRQTPVSISPVGLPDFVLVQSPKS